MIRIGWETIRGLIQEFLHEIRPQIIQLLLCSCCLRDRSCEERIKVSKPLIFCPLSTSYIPPQGDQIGWQKLWKVSSKSQDPLVGLDTPLFYPFCIFPASAVPCWDPDRISNQIAAAGSCGNNQSALNTLILGGRYELIISLDHSSSTIAMNNKSNRNLIMSLCTEESDVSPGN